VSGYACARRVSRATSLNVTVMNKEVTITSQKKNEPLKEACLHSKQSRTASPLRQAAWGALLLMSAALAGCNQVPPLNNEAAPESGASFSSGDSSGPDPSYRDIVANHLKTAFKNYSSHYSSYEASEISAPRRVHSLQGWSWISCVRFQDRGRRRTYAVFFEGGKVTEARFAVQTDDCGTQAYALFEQMRGQGLPPLH
jgi:hypothetical protein